MIEYCAELSFSGNSETCGDWVLLSVDFFVRVDTFIRDLSIRLSSIFDSGL